MEDEFVAIWLRARQSGAWRSGWLGLGGTRLNGFGLERSWQTDVGLSNPYPRPRPYATPPFAIHDHAVFAKVVLAAFGQRRKTLRNSLAGLMDAAAITAAGVDPGARPETLAPAQFAALAAQVGA